MTADRRNPEPCVTKGDASLDGRTIELRIAKRQFYVACPDMGVHASGPDAQTALAALGKALVERRRFEEESGLLRSSRRSGVSVTSGAALKRWAGVLLVTGLIAFQLSYGISTGLSRGIGRGFNAEWRDNLIASLEERLIALGAAKDPPGADRQRQLVEVVRALKARYGPVWDEVVAPRPSPPARNRP